MQKAKSVIKRSKIALFLAAIFIIIQVLLLFGIEVILMLLYCLQGFPDSQHPLLCPADDSRNSMMYLFALLIILFLLSCYIVFTVHNRKKRKKISKFMSGY